MMIIRMCRLFEILLDQTPLDLYVFREAASSVGRTSLFGEKAYLTHSTLEAGTYCSSNCSNCW